MSVDDANSVDYAAGGGHASYHKVLGTIAEDRDNVVQFDVTVKLEDGTGSAKYLYLWDFTDVEWDLKDSDNGLGVNTLTYQGTGADITRYISATEEMRVKGANNDPALLKHYFTEVVITQ